MTHRNGTQALAEQEAAVEQVVAEASAVQAPALQEANEPKLHSLEWFNAVILGNEQIAAQKLAEFNQVTGAIMLLKQQRDMVEKQQ